MAYLLWHQMAEAARRDGSRPAVSHRRTTLTYEELDRESTRFANLLASHGIGPGARVGMFMEKSVRSVVTMLGVLKAGAAYVPIDPAAPILRAAFILKDCQVSGLVTTERRLAALMGASSELSSLRLAVAADATTTPAQLPGVSVVEWAAISARPAELPAVGTIEDDPAYLLYTSGSTGTPKGVILTHRHALTFVDWGAETFEVGPDDRLSNHAPLHFDLSVFDIYVALRSGACVVIVPDEVAPFPVQQAEWIRSERITVWYSVPSALIRMLLHGRFDKLEYPALRVLLFAGEVFPIKYLRELRKKVPNARLVNLYGPTETNVCTFYEVHDLPEDQTAEIPIGKACADTEVFAIDDDGGRVGTGGVGELYVRGPAVMKGYWNLPDRTARALVRHPLQPAYHEWAYRTGDYVRLREDGNYDFLGRRDNMVKSRGYRIELGEIEQVVYSHESVREAVVVAIPEEEIGARLKLVVVPHVEGQLTAKDIETFCAARLPKYMVPELIEFRTELPRTSTGKADRVAILQQSQAEGQSACL